MDIISIKEEWKHELAHDNLAIFRLCPWMAYPVVVQRHTQSQWWKIWIPYGSGTQNLTQRSCTVGRTKPHRNAWLITELSKLCSMFFFILTEFVKYFHMVVHSTESTQSSHVPYFPIINASGRRCKLTAWLNSWREVKHWCRVIVICFATGVDCLW